MKLSLIASAAGLAVIATAAHAQYAAPDGAKQGAVPDAIGTVTEKSVRYSLAPGESSKLIRPPAGTPVWVVGTQTDSGYRGIGQVVLYRAKGNFLEWTWLDLPPSSVITEGYSGAPATHILWLDYGHGVDIQVNGPDSFVVHNGGGSQADGKVTLLW